MNKAQAFKWCNGFFEVIDATYDHKLELKEVGFFEQKDAPGVWGAYIHRTKSIYLSEELLSHPTWLRTVFNHELTHLVFSQLFKKKGERHHKMISFWRLTHNHGLRYHSATLQGFVK